MYPRLKNLREDSDRTQQDIADFLAYTRSAYAKIERGEHMLTAEVLTKLSELYDVSTDYLLGLSDYPKRIKKNIK
ncbi:TPA: helix-turn-helix transcriptional regulator [Streptococcus suis]|uniref:helix-turn-helix domain-containing protein n=1 Tax=Streptococcus suis TaxID=1307 RepID=UPI00040A69A7|nr:helix-turn-helix transcriptional regulator [Streptococcus suis 10581]HEM3576214.1 helix-turn-helix transcriptional regulator [Streptococcus suis]HEM3585973.1 helix-turn-helix transcriptional regulator [Streptococcus suis]HEM6310488.1 helix-turn-helix transcriptional regulator [Streptococcus suis]